MKRTERKRIFITIVTVFLVLGQFTSALSQTRESAPNRARNDQTSNNSNASARFVRTQLNSQNQQTTVIDAAFFHRGTNKSYFFQGSKYYRLTGTRVDAGYPVSLPGGWKGLPTSFRSGIDAAVHMKSNNKIYFFKGNQYLRISDTTVDRGYPAKLPGGWRGMPADFARGIDSAVSHNGFIYMYKGNKQIKFDGSAKMVGGVENIPTTIKRNGNFDAALRYQPNGRNYYFSGSKYLRTTGFVSDRGYPASLPGGWKGIRLVATPSANPPTGNFVVVQPPSDMIDYGRPPVSTAEEEKILKWIAVRTSALRVPYCYRKSINRGAGKPLTQKCAAGLEKSGLLCYPKCRAGYKGVGPLCSQKCAAGFKDVGGFCQKTGSYNRGAGMTKRRCERSNPGGCEKAAALWYPKCRAGFVGSATRCRQKCPAGQADTGTGCRKPSYTRTAGVSTICPAGLERGTKGGKQGLLCYKACSNPNYTGVGPTCWQNCPVQHPTACGFGCATTKGACASVISDHIISPIMAVVSLSTLGTAAAAANAAKANEGVVKATIELGAKAEKLTKLGKAVERIKKIVASGQKTATNLVGGAKNLKTLGETVKIGGNIFKASTILGKEVNLFAKEFSNDFANQTSPEIDAEINKRFGRHGADYIKRQWAVRHLSMMLEAIGFSTAKNLLSLVSIADPTGLVAVANAYMHPRCKDSTPFPRVTLLHKN